MLIVIHLQSSVLCAIAHMKSYMEKKRSGKSDVFECEGECVSRIWSFIP